MKQTIQATSVNTLVSVKVGTILSWHTAAKVYNSLPYKFGIVKFMSHLCGAKNHIQASQASGSIDNRKHWQFYYNPLHISMMYVVLRSSGLYRAAFFIIHLIAKNQMKQTIEVAGTYVPASVKAGMIFSWHTVAKVLNALPLGICECKTIEDAKGYVKALTIILSMFLLAAIEKGGTL